MSSDAQQFERAIGNWEDLHSQRAYSLPADLGSTAIVCSYFRNISGLSEGNAEKDVKSFRKEALGLADEMAAYGESTEVILNATEDDMSAVMTDPEFSSVVTIGHGALSFLYVGESRYDWIDVSANSDHLKTGMFIQRHCGSFLRMLSVPLGAFAMMDHRNVLAPVGRYFAPRGFDHPHNDRLKHVSSTRRLSYRYIKERFNDSE